MNQNKVQLNQDFTRKFAVFQLARHHLGPYRLLSRIRRQRPHPMQFMQKVPYLMTCQGASIASSSGSDEVS